MATDVLNENEPIRVVLTPEGLVIWAGRPRVFTAAESREYTQPGYKIEEMTIGEYRKKNLKWVYDTSDDSEG